MTTPWSSARLSPRVDATSSSQFAGVALSPSIGASTAATNTPLLSSQASPQHSRRTSRASPYVDLEKTEADDPWADAKSNTRRPCRACKFTPRRSEAGSGAWRQCYSDNGDVGDASAKPALDRRGWRCFLVLLGHCKKLLIVLALLLLLAIALIVSSHFILLALLARVPQSLAPQNGVTAIVNRLMAEDGPPTEPFWVPDFTRGVEVVACHSHNDYTRTVPLYNALQYGCTGVEADIHLDDDDLYIGHAFGSALTLDELYVKPLVTMLQNQNQEGEDAVLWTSLNGDSSMGPRGVFDMAPNQTLTLLCDHKTDPLPTYRLLVQQIEPLRAGGWLTTYDTSTGVLKMGPITVVATGAPDAFALINTPSTTNATGDTTRDIFFDAPLERLVDADNPYNYTNSYYASVSTLFGLGLMLPTGFTSAQVDEATRQIAKAQELGLLSRYWGNPTWPLSLSLTILKEMANLQVGMLNVDDLRVATRLDWDWCTIMGVDLC